jgi:amino-acid N-acetyltransferase
MLRIDRAPPPIVREATSADLPAIASLLEESGLPTADLAASNPRFVVAHLGTEIVGAGALQVFGANALLRSLAVSPALRSEGLGTSILHRLEEWARANHIAQLALLTQTAERFFHRHGYHVVERSVLPAAFHASAEFQSLCPASATCMHKLIDERPHE